MGKIEKKQQGYLTYKERFTFWKKNWEKSMAGVLILIIPLFTFLGFRQKTIIIVIAWITLAIMYGYIVKKTNKADYEYNKKVGLE